MNEDPDFDNKECWIKSHLGLWDYALRPAHWEYSRAGCAETCNDIFTCKSVTFVDTSGECALFSNEDSQMIPIDHDDREKFLFATKQCFYDGGYQTGLSTGGIVGIAVAAGVLGLIILLYLCQKCCNCNCNGSHVRHVQNGQNLNSGSGARHVYNGAIQNYSNTQTQIQLQQNAQESVINYSIQTNRTESSNHASHRNIDEEISEDRATVPGPRPNCPPAGSVSYTHLTLPTIYSV